MKKLWNLAFGYFLAAMAIDDSTLEIKLKEAVPYFCDSV